MRISFDIYFFLTTMIAIGFALIWYISPLALGFADSSTSIGRHQLGMQLYGISYAIGMPGLVVGQIISGCLNLIKYRKAAFVVPLATISFFLATAGGGFALL